MKHTFRIAFFALFTVLISSCAKQPEDPGTYTYETKAFQDWMAKYLPTVPQVAGKIGRAHV